MRKLVIAAIIAFATPIASYADLIQFGTEVDISSCPNFSGSGVQQCNLITGIPTQTLEAGDVVDFSVTFANSGQLTMFDDDGGTESFFGWLDRVGEPSNFQISNASITFDNLIGTLNAPLFLSSQSSGSAHIGPAFSSDFIATGSSISFSGYQVQFTVDSIAIGSNTYSANWLFAQADRLAYTTAVVPEPGTLALLGAGLIGMGFVRRRKKA